MTGLGAFSFEVFGNVQKVYFRQHTLEEAQRLGLVGWVANTVRGSVIGECQGSQAALHDMKEWLTHRGSPASTIERAEFKGERQVSSLAYTTFERKPGKLP